MAALQQSFQQSEQTGDDYSINKKSHCTIHPQEDLLVIVFPGGSGRPLHKRFVIIPALAFPPSCPCHELLPSFLHDLND